MDIQTHYQEHLKSRATLDENMIMHDFQLMYIIIWSNNEIILLWHSFVLDMTGSGDRRDVKFVNIRATINPVLGE